MNDRDVEVHNAPSMTPEQQQRRRNHGARGQDAGAAPAVSQHRRPRLRASLRVTAYAAVLVTLGAWLTARSVSASVSEKALALGRSLSDWHGAVGSSTTVSLNGEEVTVSSFRSSQSLDALFRAFALLCEREVSDAPRELVAEAAKQSGKPVEAPAGVFRLGGGNTEGALVCFSGATELPTLAGKIRQFTQSGDLATIGQLRYLFAKRSGDRTQGLLLSSSGSLRLAKLFPEGEAEGRDLIDGARPRGSTRLLALCAQGADHGLTIHRSPEPVSAALASYEMQLERAGYRVERLPDFPADDAGRLAVRMATGDAGAFMVSAGNSDGTTLVSTVLLGSMDASRFAGDARGPLHGVRQRRARF